MAGASDPPETPAAAPDDFVQANFRRNYRAHFADGMLSFTGFRLISSPTFTPAFLFALTGTATLVGVGSALIQAGAMLSPLLVAAMLEQRRRIKPAALGIGLFMRLMILALALAGWLLSGTEAIVASFAVLFLLGLGTGGQRVAFQMLLAKVIPLARRGRLQGLRNFFGGMLAACLSYFAGSLLLERELLGNGYSAIFLLAFLLSALGLAAIALGIREPEAAAVLPRRTLRARFSLMADTDFRRFVFAQAACTLARAASPFYILFVGSTIGLSGEVIGLLAFCFAAADTASNLLWGQIGDRTGYRTIFLCTVILWIVSTAVLLTSSGQVSACLAFVGFGASFSGFLMTQQTMVLELGPREDIAMRLGLVSTVDGVIAAIGPVLGGLILSSWGFEPLFLTSAALLLVSLVWIVRMRDPRRLGAER